MAFLAQGLRLPIRRIQAYLRAQMPVWKLRHPGVEDMHVAVMGCVVNGPGESKHANIGISLPGSGESPVAPVYVDGAKTVTLKGNRIAEEFQQIVENYVQRTYGSKNGSQHGLGVAGVNAAVGIAGTSFADPGVRA